jgi:hypothetical protein
MQWSAGISPLGLVLSIVIPSQRHVPECHCHCHCHCQCLLSESLRVSAPTFQSVIITVFFPSLCEWLSLSLSKPQRVSINVSESLLMYLPISQIVTVSASECDSCLCVPPSMSLSVTATRLINASERHVQQSVTVSVNTSLGVTASVSEYHCQCP